MHSRGRAIIKLTAKLVIWLSLLVLVSYLAWQWLHDPNNRPIAHVEVNASYQHLDQVEIEQMVTPLLQQGFYGSSAIKLQQQLAGMPWVAQASFKRVWPDTLVITLVEHEAVARWGDKGVMDKNGDLFFPPLDSIPPGMPKLSGPEVLAPKIFDAYHQMQEILAPEVLRITDIIVSPRHSWQVKLNNGVTLELGREQQIQRLTRFTKAWPQLVAKHHGMITKVDLRYPNGAAVQ